MYDSCCSHGKFVEEELLMREHEFSTSFHGNIRNVNSAFAFGSMEAEAINFPSELQYFKVHGQVYHLVNMFVFQ